MHIIEDYAIFKAREAATMQQVAGALAEAQDDLCRCDALLSLLDSLE